MILLLISTSIIAERAWHGAHAVDAQWGEEARAIGQLDLAAAEAARDEACRLRAEAIESLNAANLAFQNAEAEHEQEVAHYTENISMFNQLVTEGEERLQVLETQNAELERRCGECEKQMHELKAQRVCWLCDSGEELPGRPMRCPDGHAICEGCMDAMLEARASDYTGLVKVCCSFLKVGNQACGREYTTDVLERASSAAYARYNVALALHEQEEAARAAAAAALPPLAEGVVALTPEEVRLIAQVRRPCCGAPVIDFDMCYCVRCNVCPKQFCAWCFQVYEGNINMHSHIEREECPKHPYPGRLFPNTPADREALANAWKARAYDQLQQSDRTNLDGIRPSNMDDPMYY